MRTRNSTTRLDSNTPPVVAATTNCPSSTVRRHQRTTTPRTGLTAIRAPAAGVEHAQLRPDHRAVRSDQAEVPPAAQGQRDVAPTACRVPRSESPAGLLAARPTPGRGGAGRTTRQPAPYGHHLEPAAPAARCTDRRASWPPTTTPSRPTSAGIRPPLPTRCRPAMTSPTPSLRSGMRDVTPARPRAGTPKLTA